MYICINMATRIVNVRLGNKLIREVDNIVKKTTFNSRTEFIREAIRNELQEERKRLAFKILEENYSKGKTKTTKKELEKTRKEAVKELFKERKIKL